MMKRLLLTSLLFAASQLCIAAPNVLLLAAPPVQLGKLESLEPIAAEQGIELDYKMLENDSAVTANELKGYDFLIIDAAYGPAVAMLQQQLLPNLKSSGLPWLWLRRDGNQSQQLPAHTLKQLDSYYVNGGAQNYSGYFCTLHAFLSKAAADCVEPKIYPEAAIYHPDAHSEVFTSLKDYLVFRVAGVIAKTPAPSAAPQPASPSKKSTTDAVSSATQLAKNDSKPANNSRIKETPQPASKAQSLVAADKPVIGILFHKSYMDSGLTQMLDATIAGLEERGALAVPIYASAMQGGEITSLATYQGQVRLDALINMQIMLNSAARQTEFEALGVSVLQMINYHKGDVDEWQQDPIGLTPMDIPFYLSEPEYAGLIDPIVASASTSNDSQQPIERQLNAVLNKALNLAHLKHSQPSTIKTAIMFYNYPPGETNLGASFLNVPKSLETLLAAYQQRGYDVKTRNEDQLVKELTALLAPFYRPGKLTELVQQGNAGKLPLETYLTWFKSLPQNIQARVNERWGAPEQASLKVQDKDYFAIPALRLGKQIILPQPPRSEWEADKEKLLYHDTQTPPSHSYLATYLWLRNTVKIDALVHFGTHGSQEWQPGKERGLDVLNDPLLTVGDIPILYPYIMDDIGEALQTKRRGRAVTISHNTPSFGPAGLHNELTELHELLHQWGNLTDGEVKNQVAKRITDASAALNLDKDLGLDLDHNDFSDTVAQLHLHLHDIALAHQPLGLAHFGSAAEDDLRLFTVQQMLGEPLITALMQTDLLPTDAEEAEELLMVDYEQLKHTPVWQWLDTHIRQGKALKDANATLLALVETGKQHWKNLSNENELEGFFTALSGRYLSTSYGGDPIKNPDSLPTGRNLYGFDPSRIPTVDAWEAGKIAAERLLEQHKTKNGEYPTKLAFTLWSVETMRHLGLLEAQAFYLMGYKPVWGRGERIEGIEKIPSEELGRPRVDVVISATGLYRDHFPQVMKWLAQAVDQASKLDEANNPIATNSRAIEQKLLALGMPADEAKRAAHTRIFASASGAYSTGLDDATLASDSFGETDSGAQDHQAGDEKLANLYLERMQYAYGPDESHWGEKSEVNIYAQQLTGVQGAVLSRSSNLYGMLTTDDPFQYLGGIGLAVRHLTGKSPSLYISNLRDGNNPKAETAAGFLARDLRTRYLHPGWIKNMQQEGYSGTLQILGSANNLWGWQVVSPEVVRDDQWQEYKAVYLDDKYNLDINQWFEDNNPQAQAQLIERMLEAARKEYWQTDEQTLQDLAQRYQELAEKYDVQSDNQRFQEYAKQAAAGFGLQVPTLAAADNASSAEQPQAQSAETSAAVTEQVQGQKLEKQENTEEMQPQPYDLVAAASVLIVLLAFLSGILRQKRKAQII